MYCSIVDEGPGGFRTNSKQAVAEHEAKTKDKRQGVAKGQKRINSHCELRRQRVRISLSRVAN